MYQNMYFGLQTGWVSSMSMPSSLIGYAFFKTLSKHLDLPFTPVENVLVQTVAGSMGTMPLGCGFVGVMPALNYMLTKEEGGPLILSTWKLIIWALGLCFFGVVFAVPLRKQVIIREKLKFPSGTATALMIGVLHGKEARDVTIPKPDTRNSVRENRDDDDTDGLLSHDSNRNSNVETGVRAEMSGQNSWRARVKLLSLSFLVSGLYTLATYFIPKLRDLPVFGTALASSWLWTLNPSLAYVGQGIIMGPATTIHMLLGALVGWGVLSPLAKNRGWAPGPVDDWETGSKGWIVWISLAIMMADAIVSLGYIAGRPIYLNGGDWLAEARSRLSKGSWKALVRPDQSSQAYSRLESEGADFFMVTFHSSSNAYERPDTEHSSRPTSKQSELPEPDAPPEHLVSERTVWIGLGLSLAACVIMVRIVFGDLVPLYANVLALPIALVLSLMGVRALGETDLNPVSGISKIAQLFFALIVPASNKNNVLINLIAGAVSESGALQAGDLMQDLKTGHLLGAAPNAQFWGQIIGSAVGAVVSALIYGLYTSVYDVPGKLFQVPTGYVWIFTARLVTGMCFHGQKWWLLLQFH